MAAPIAWPNDSQHAVVIGRNGSGKTQGAVYMLSRRTITRRPWIIFNWKRDDLIRAIPGAQPLGLSDRLPKKPGVYLTEPVPKVDDERVNDLLWRVWDREGIGLFVDEAYMLPSDDAAFQAILTQGRSKHIPTITLTQRPVWVSRFVFSEAAILQLYRLTDSRDLKTVREFIPLPITRRLPGQYYSWWYDAVRETGAVVAPVPDRETILGGFQSRIGPYRRAF